MFLVYCSVCRVKWYCSRWEKAPVSEKTLLCIHTIELRILMTCGISSDWAVLSRQMQSAFMVVEDYFHIKACRSERRIFCISGMEMPLPAIVSQFFQKLLFSSIVYLPSRIVDTPHHDMQRETKWAEVFPRIWGDWADTHNELRSLVESNCCHVKIWIAQNWIFGK